MPDSDEPPTPPWGHKSEPRRREERNSLETIARSARDTSDMSARTLDRVGGLRAEIMGHLGKQDAQISGIEGKLDMLIDEFQVDRAERSAIRVSKQKARIEIEKTDEIALIDEKADQAKHRRALTLKILVVAGPVVSAIVAALVAGGC